MKYMHEKHCSYAHSSLYFRSFIFLFNFCIHLLWVSSMWLLLSPSHVGPFAMSLAPICVFVTPRLCLRRRMRIVARKSILQKTVRVAISRLIVPAKVRRAFGRSKKRTARRYGWYGRLWSSHARPRDQFAAVKYALTDFEQRFMRRHRLLRSTVVPLYCETIVVWRNGPFGGKIAHLNVVNQG